MGRPQKKAGARPSPSPAPQEERRTSHYPRQTSHQEHEPATSENAKTQDILRRSGDSRLQPSTRQLSKAPRVPPGGEFSDDEGSPEESRKIPVQSHLNLNRGIDYKTVFLSVVVSVVVLAVPLAVVVRDRQTDPIYVPVGNPQDPETLEAIQAMQEKLRGEFDSKLANLHIIEASEVQGMVTSTLKPYLDHIENHLLKDRVKQIVEEMLAKISIPSNENIEDIAEKVVEERLASKLQESDNKFLQKLREMEDRLVGKIEEGASAPDEGLRAEVGRLRGQVGRLGLGQAREGLERKAQGAGLLSALEDRMTGARSQVLALLYTTEKLQAEARHTYMVCVGSLMLAALALVLACRSRTARLPPSSATSQPANPQPANPQPAAPATTPPRDMGPFVAGLAQRERMEKEALSQWSGTLERAVCVVHFGRELRQHYRQLTEQVMQGVTQGGMQGRVLEAAVERPQDILNVPGARLYLLFVNFNERNVILESPEKGTGDLRLSTVQALQRRGAEVVVIYTGDKGSALLPAPHLYNLRLTSVKSHPVLIELSRWNHFLSIHRDFLPQQQQRLQDVAKTALNGQT